MVQSFHTDLIKKVFSMSNSINIIKRYFKGKFRADLSAGTTVAMIVIPQSLAYASIAGINPIFGLFTAIVPTIIAAVFGSFPFLITGPTNPTALVTASVLLGYAGRADYFELVFALAIIAGLFNIVFGLLKLGGITRYISNSVLVGFLTAAGVLIIASQLGSLFGIELSKEGGLWGIVSGLGSNLQKVNVFSLLIGITGIVMMLFIRKLNRKLPASLITVLLTSLLVYLLKWNDSLGVKLVLDIGLPEQIRLGFHIPNLSLQDFASLGFSGLAVALFGFMETISISKSMSQMTGEDLDPSREMLGQGLASFVGGFFQCMPSAGSPSRTVVNVVSGAKTRWAGVISGISVLTFLLLFSGLLGYIPIATLAAIVIVSAAGLINIGLIKLTWQSRIQSRVVMVLTLVSTLILPMEYAIYIGILSSILIFLGESGQVKLSYIIENDDGQFIELPMDRIEERKPQIAIVNIEGDLYFAAAEGLQHQIERILEMDIKVLIMRFRRTHLLASTGIMTLDHLIRSARKKDVKVLLCGIHDEIREPLESAGILRIVGGNHSFSAKEQLFVSTQEALKEAKALIKNKTVPSSEE